jgi:hypothetical protein
VIKGGWKVLMPQGRRQSQGRMCMPIRTLKMLMAPKVKCKLKAWWWGKCPKTRKSGQTLPPCRETGESCAVVELGEVGRPWFLLQTWSQLLSIVLECVAWTS